MNNIKAVSPDVAAQLLNTLTADFTEAAGARKATGAGGPAIPLDVFPAEPRAICEALESGLNFPREFTALSMLVAAALAIGNTHVVRVKNNWNEPPILYGAIVGRPGTVKSHVLTLIFRYFERQDSKWYHEYCKAREEAEEKARQNKLTARNNKNAAPPADPEKPVRNAWMLGDATPEALNVGHRDNPRSMVLLADELAAWFKNFNRYNSGSEGETWLSIFSGKAIRVDRKNSEPIFINRPFICVIGTIQPAVLTELAKDGRGSNGFLERMLFAYPADLRILPWNDHELDPNVTDRWEVILDRLASLGLDRDEFGNIKPREVSFSTEAYQTLRTWQAECAQRLNDDDNDIAAGIQSKMQIYAIRLSLVLEALEWACGYSQFLEISLKSVNGALALVEYFRSTTERVYSIINRSDTPEDNADARRQLYDALPPAFTTAEGKTAAQALGIADRSTERYLKDSQMYQKTGHGKYQKIAQ
jgi:hypothetical protein